MVNLPKFVIQLDRFNSDISKVSLLLEKYAEEQRQSGYQVSGKSFSLQAQLLRNFPVALFNIIEREASTQGEDVFGNEFLGILRYTHIEIAVDSSYQIITAIRLLDNSVTLTENKNRYTIFSTVNTLDPTTINIVSDIQNISDQTNELFGIPGLSEALRCGTDFNVLEGVVNRAGSTVGLAEQSLPGGGISSEINWTDFANTYFFPTPKIVPNQVPLLPEDIKKLSQKFDSTSEKTAEELARENDELASARFKLNLNRTRSGGFELNNAGSAILGNTEKVRSEIQGAVGDPVVLLNQCYQQVFDKFSLGCLIKSAAECIIPPLTCKEILRGLRVDTIQERIGLAFPNQPRVVDLVNEEIDKIREANPDEEITTDQFLDAIELFIDLEALCDVVNFASGESTIPTIEIPELPIVDLFASVTVEIENAILEALIQAIKEMIVGILEDLASCDTLDAFVAGALQGQFGPDAGVAGDLANLFLEPEVVTDPERGAVASSLGNRWEQFSRRVDDILGDAVQLRASGSAELFGGAANIRNEISALGGIEGLADAIASGEVSELTGSVLIQNMLEGEIDVTELLSFQGQGSEALNQILREIGRFELSDDGQSFTLRRISDDQVVTILQAASVAPPVQLQVNTGTLSNVLGKALDDVVSVLSPGETLELLAGEPTERIITIVREIIRIRYPELAAAGDPISLFIALGESTGLNQLRDGVILLAQNDQQRDIPRKFCPEDDDRIRLREDILVRGGLDPAEVEEEIDRIVETRRIRFNELIDILGRDGDFTPEEILDNIRCGTGFQPNGQRPDVIEDQLDATINIMFEPTKMAFDREVPKFVNAISSTRKIKRIVPRKVSAKDGAAAFNTGGDGGFFQSLTSFLGGLAEGFNEGSADLRVNPEFRKLVNDGFVPLEVNGNPEDPQAGLDSELAFPYSNKDTPIEVSDVVKEAGGLFKRGIKIDQDDVTIDEELDSLSLSIKGSLKVDSPISDYVKFNRQPPRWLLRYKEENNEFDLRIKSEGEIPSALYGTVPFFENYSFNRVFQDDTPPEIQARLDDFNNDSERILTRKEVFSRLFLDKIRNALEIPNEEQEEAVRDTFAEQYDEFVKDFLFDAGSSFSRNRLLRKLPNKSLRNLGPEINPASLDEATQLIVLNLINFSPTPTPEQRACKADPHLLDLEFVRQIVKEQFDRECENPNDPNDGVTASRKPINSAGFVGVVLTIVRLYVVEYIFRALFVFDEFGYSNTFAEDPLLIDYISFRIREDITRLGFWDRFEKEMLVAYDKLNASNVLQVEDVPATDDGSQGLVDIQGSGNESPYESEARATDIRGLPEQLKILTRETLKSVFFKISELVGKPDDADISFSRAFVNNLRIVDTYSNFDFEEDGSALSEFESNVTRFVGTNDERGQFVLEKYIRVEESDDSLLNQDSEFLKNVVALNNWEQFLERAPAERQQTPLEDLYENPWRMGLRLVYITPKIEDDVENPPSLPSFNKMRLGEQNVDLNTDTIQQEKSLYFVEQRNEVEPNGDTKVKYRQFNSIVVAQEEVELDQFNTIEDARGNIELIYDDLEESLLQRISQNEDYRVLFEYSFFANRLTTLMAIYSSFIVNSEEMKFLFEGTKLELRRLFETMENIGDYTFRTDVGAAENASAYQTQFNNIGNPAGPSGPDALYLASITPILILKGLTELVDPNINLTSKIVAAAAAGYFSPKFERVSGEVRIEGTENTVNFPDEIVATESVFTRDQETGELVVRADAVETTVIDTPEETRTLRQVKSLAPGAPIIAYTQVMEVETDETGAPVLDNNGQPRPKTNENGDVLIKEGPGFKGVRVPGGETSALDIAAAADETLRSNTFGLVGLTDIDPAFDIVDSIPVYPGESINLPYGLVSPALLPINVFGLTVPWSFCGPPYSVLGPTFLQFEPAIYQLPHFQSVYAKSDISEEVKKKYNIDLSGKEKFDCPDDEEEEER
jgi:hypothetical protein